MTGAQLKNSILQWAIEGKLVPQDPNEESATVLLEKIRAEKLKMVKEGKLKKKDVVDSEIYKEGEQWYERVGKEVKEISEEIPFEIPEGWRWVRLGEIGASCLYPFADGPFGSNLKREHYVLDKEVRIIQLSNIGEEGWKDNNVKYTSFKHAKTIERSMVDSGNIVIAKMMPAGRAIEVPNIDRAYILSSDAVKFVPHESLNKKYLLYAINSNIVRTQIYSEVQGITRIRTSLSKLKRYLVPIPPIKEQERIVQVLSQELFLIKKYEKAQQELDVLNKTLPERLRKSILQEAIQGKLVPQNPEEGSAAELLKSIAQEKQKLLAEGKLKKKDISDSEIYKSDDGKWYSINGEKLENVSSEYTYPLSWKLVRLNMICELKDGEKQEGKQICLDAKFLRKKANGAFLDKGKYVRKGDSIILVDGENSGEVFIAPIDGYMGSTFKELVVCSQLYKPYVLHFLSFYKDVLRNSKKGAAIPHLNKELFKNLVFGIPPYREQERIVAKIDEMFKLLK